LAGFNTTQYVLLIIWLGLSF